MKINFNRVENKTAFHLKARQTPGIDNRDSVNAEDDKIPVNIFNGELKVDLTEVFI